MSANPHANGGLLRRPLALRDFRDHAVEVTGARRVGARGHPGPRPVPRRRHPRQPGQLPHLRPRRDRVEPARRGLRGDRQGLRRTDRGRRRAPRTQRPGRGDAVRAHLPGLAGGLPADRPARACSAATRRSSTSSTRCSTSTPSGSRPPDDLEWRPPIASLNYLLTSHVWRQDHNGFSHQDPGFIDHVVNKKAEVVRVYLPPDTNTLLSTMRHCLASTHYVNVVVAGKQPSFDWLDAEAADLHCARGLGIWDWASSGGDDPDVVIACAGDVPTLEALAAVGDPARATARPAGALRQRRGPDAAAGRDRAPARAVAPRLRHGLHRGQAGDLRLPRLPVADPPPDLPAHQPRTTSTCAATRRRAPRRRRSTW